VSRRRRPSEALVTRAINGLSRPGLVPHPLAPTLESRVSGKSVLVTGASSGIGRGLAVRVAEAGATVLVTARRGDELDELVAEIAERGGKAVALPGDLSTEEGVDALADRVLAEHGTPHVLVNNAGRSIRRSIARSEHRLHDYERAMQINYLGAVGLTLRMLPGMRERRSGHVLTSSSIGVSADLPRFSAYIGSKAALEAFCRVAAIECLADGVTFTTVHLPLVDTEMIGPSGWDFSALSVDEAVDMMVDGLRRRPREVNAPLGSLTRAGLQFMPETTRRGLHLFHRWVPDSPAARDME
jgi:NAD(P)-dependent dehydrogenase (short-subunit alcohol dehydrogenase family)